MNLYLPAVVWIPVAALYLLCSLGLVAYGLHCYVMIALFLRRQRPARAAIAERIADYNTGRADADYPRVTLQLPIYNEAEVVEGLLRSVFTLDYPRSRFAVQVLDDSTDETRELVDALSAELAYAGVTITVLRRSVRTDYKAGALKAGMDAVHGDCELLAIFDADFVIPPNFLRRTVALLHDEPQVACVQARWGHANRDENWLTRAQSVGIDGHFTAEQGARGYHRLFMNFNGTAGIWRRTAIVAGGGWQGDTLTEDLDLSYRVQLAGYRIAYDFDLECPAEIPNNVMALKSQQRRWAKGSIETARKLLPRLLRDPSLPWYRKVEAVLHLTHYMVAVLMTALCALTLPMLIGTPLPHAGWLLMAAWGLIVISALAPATMYTGSGLVLRRGRFALLHYPAMLAVGTGLCLNNALAVGDALLGRKTAFVRTPKSGSQGRAGGPGLAVRTGRYRADGSLLQAFAEIGLGLYCLFTLAIYLDSAKYLFGCFIAAYAFGLLAFGFATLAERLRRTRVAAPEGHVLPATATDLDALRDV